MTLPLHADVRNGIRRWGMLGNDTYGDCVEAALAHIEMCKATANASSWKKLLYRIGFKPPTPAWTVGLYSSYLTSVGETLKQDPGTMPPLFFAWMKSQGYIIDWGFVGQPPSIGSEDRVHQAMSDYRGLLLTVTLTLDAYNNFFGRTPWSIGPNPNDQPDPSLQHAVALVAYGPQRDTVISWARTKSVTRPFMADCANGAYVFLTEQDKSNPNFAQLLANIKNL